MDINGAHILKKNGSSGLFNQGTVNTIGGTSNLGGGSNGSGAIVNINPATTLTFSDDFANGGTVNNANINAISGNRTLSGGGIYTLNGGSIAAANGNGDGLISDNTINGNGNIGSATLPNFTNIGIVSPTQTRPSPCSRPAAAPSSTAAT